jgi:hypothetical protein
MKTNTINANAFASTFYFFADTQINCDIDNKAKCLDDQLSKDFIDEIGKDNLD